MELIKKNICIRDYQCRAQNNWGELSGYTSDGNVQYYNVNSSGITANLLTMQILFTNSYDNIGFYVSTSEIWEPLKTYYRGEVVIFNNKTYRCKEIHSTTQIFNLNEWESNFGEYLIDGNDIILVNNTNSVRIDFLGESKVNEFRRYSKKEEDIDLYNPNWNSGFTQEITNTHGNINKIINSRINNNGGRQNLYDYILGASKDDLENTGIHYKDIDNRNSEIHYITSGLTEENSIMSPYIKQEYLLGVIEEPRIINNVNIDRGVNSTYEKNLKLGEIRSLSELEAYGNGFFKINNN